MKKVTKALKLVNSLSEEERQEFAEFFKPEEAEEAKDPEQKEPAKEVKKEVKEEVSKEDTTQKDERFEKLLEGFETLAQEIKSIKEKQPKLKDFGAKQKQGEGKEVNDFDTLFGNLTSGENTSILSA